MSPPQDDWDDDLALTRKVDPRDLFEAETRKVERMGPRGTMPFVRPLPPSHPSIAHAVSEVHGATFGGYTMRVAPGGSGPALFAVGAAIATIAFMLAWTEGPDIVARLAHFVASR